MFFKVVESIDSMSISSSLSVVSYHDPSIKLIGNILVPVNENNVNKFNSWSIVVSEPRKLPSGNASNNDFHNEINELIP